MKTIYIIKTLILSLKKKKKFPVNFFLKKKEKKLTILEFLNVLPTTKKFNQRNSKISLSLNSKNNFFLGFSEKKKKKKKKNS